MLHMIGEIHILRYSLVSVLTLAAFLFSSDVWSQTPQPVFSHYKVDDGLPSSEVHHVMQDSKGYMWFATDLGVSRFDGYRFENFAFKEGLADNTIFNIYEDYQGRIWFMSFSGRLSFFHEGTVTTYKYNNALEKEVTSLAKGSFYVDKGNALFIATSNRGYLKIDDEGIVTRNNMNNHYSICIVNRDSTPVFVYGGPKRGEAKHFEVITDLDTAFIEFRNFDHRTSMQCISLRSNDLLYSSGRVVTSITPSLSYSNYTISNDALATLEDSDRNI